MAVLKTAAWEGQLLTSSLTKTALSSWTRSTASAGGVAGVRSSGSSPLAFSPELSSEALPVVNLQVRNRHARPSEQSRRTITAPMPLAPPVTNTPRSLTAEGSNGREKSTLSVVFDSGSYDG